MRLNLPGLKYDSGQPRHDISLWCALQTRNYQVSVECLCEEQAAIDWPRVARKSITFWLFFLPGGNGNFVAEDPSEVMLVLLPNEDDSEVCAQWVLQTVGALLGSELCPCRCWAPTQSVCLVSMNS